ncbi:hypothetical protein ACO0LK_16055 [Undibacterium sp. Ji49W]
MSWKISKFKQSILCGLLSFLVGLLGGVLEGEITSFDITVIVKILIHYFPIGFLSAWIYLLFRRDAD